MSAFVAQRHASVCFCHCIEEHSCDMADISQRERERERERQTDRQTDRQTETETETETITSISASLKMAKENIVRKCDFWCNPTPPHCSLVALFSPNNKNITYCLTMSFQTTISLFVYFFFSSNTACNTTTDSNNKTDRTGHHSRVSVF